MYQDFDGSDSKSLASYQKNPLNMLIGIQKSNEFHLIHKEVTQLRITLIGPLYRWQMQMDGGMDGWKDWHEIQNSK